MPLILVQADGEYVQVRRVGRFTIERDCADSPAHLEAAVRDAQQQMIAGLKSKGYQYVDNGFDLKGPLEHVVFSEEVNPDPGPGAKRPNPTARDEWERWERAEKARVARKAGLVQQHVDFTLTGTFRLRLRPYLRTTRGLVVPSISAG